MLVLYKKSTNRRLVSIKCWNLTKVKLVTMKFIASLAVVCFAVAFCDAATDIVYGDVTNYKLLGRIFVCADVNNRMHYNATFPVRVILIKLSHLKHHKLICFYLFLRKDHLTDTWFMESSMKIQINKHQ